MHSEEAEVAADWWADQLARAFRADIGDGVKDAMLEWAQEKLPKPDSEQVSAFRDALRDIVQREFVGSDSWMRAVAKTDPTWGSALRTLDVDYGPCPELQEALKAADLHTGILSGLPPKTVMWVNPGQVLVAHGYRKPREAIWAAA